MLSDEILAPEHATQLALFEDEYDNTLRRLFNEVQSKEDLVDVLGIPWRLIGSGLISSSDQYFGFKNIRSDYIMYWIHIDNLLLDSETSGTLGLITSSDNGATWDEGVSDYEWIQWEQSGTTQDENSSSGAAEIQVFTQLGNSATDGEQATLDIWVHNAMDASIPTMIRHTCMKGSTAAASIRFSHGAGVRIELAAHNAIALVTNSARTFTLGSYNVYALTPAKVG